MNWQEKKSVLQRAFGEVAIKRGAVISGAPRFDNEPLERRINRDPLEGKSYTTGQGYTATFVKKDVRVSYLGSGGMVPVGQGQSEGQAVSSLFKLLQDGTVKSGSKTYAWDGKKSSFRPI